MLGMYRILSLHVLLEGVDGEQRVLTAVVVVVAVVDQICVYVVLQFHAWANNQLHHVREERGHVDALTQLLILKRNY